MIKNLGLVILLEANANIINSRLKNLKTRPLLQIKNEQKRISKIRSMLKDRKEMYEDVADIIIDTSDFTPKQVVDAILY